MLRKLRFESIDVCRQEIRGIVQADASGSLQTGGNWTAGQVMSHLAAWIEYGYEGYPIKKVPFFVRWLLRINLQQMLRSGLTAGVRIPGVDGGTTGMDKIATSVAADRLLRALDRLENKDPAKYDSPAFGPMSHEDRVLLNLRHAELHLGFLSYPR